MKAYVLISVFGVYDETTRCIEGVFSSKELAEQEGEKIEEKYRKILSKSLSEGNISFDNLTEGGEIGQFNDYSELIEADSYNNYYVMEFEIDKIDKL